MSGRTPVEGRGLRTRDGNCGRWPILDALVLAGTAAAFACGGTPFRSAVDGNLPVLLVESAKLAKWAATIGTPAGARQRMITIALPVVSHLWNPQAVGVPQLVPVDLDDDPEGACAQDRFSLWSVPGSPAIWVCPAWRQCAIEGEGTLYGQAGCTLQLAHELGHVLGARLHVLQNGRAQHLGGPVMCAWQSDCIDPHLTDYTEEDVQLICGDGGHGGRCEQR